MRKLRFAVTALAATSLLALAVPALADTLVDNVDGVTIGEDGKVKRFTGLVFDEDGKVVAVLARGEARPKVDYRLDGKGRVLIPGMIDAHVHVMDIGFGALTLDLSETTSLEDALAKIKALAQDNPGRPWILGRGWNQEKWGLGRFPTAAELDAVVADRPVWLERADNHANWGNTLAITTAGVTAKTPDPSGGKIIREIVEKTGAKINIEDDGTVKIAASDQEKIDAAKNWISSIVSEPEPGTIYSGKVVKVVDFGAFVNFFGAKDGLVHVSQISLERVANPADVLSEGQEVKVKFLGMDDRGKTKLSMKVVDQTTGEDITDKINAERAERGEPPLSDDTGGRPKREGGGDRDRGRSRR
jgi:predicted RNA-binding protein with RPS1 domain